MRMRKLVVAAAALLLAITASKVFAKVGDPAPQLVVKEFNGATFDLAAHRGHVVVINFWATWCPPCRAEIPALDAVYKQDHPRGLEMIGLSGDSPHDERDARKMMSSVSYPAAMLSSAETGFQTPSTLPMTIVVGPDGVIRAENQPSDGALTEARLNAMVEPLPGSHPDKAIAVPP